MALPSEVHAPMASEQMSITMAGTHPDHDPQDWEATEAAELVDAVSGEAFNQWYAERVFAENIREGKPFFNGPPTEQPADRHSPSRLLQCHRKAYYRHCNAPKETETPQGIFWIGDQFETEIAVPFLRSLVSDDRYVRNSMWIDMETTINDEEIQIRGETDPVVVDRESRPILLTEIKTTSSVAHLDAPKRHHKAQVHAYLRGLSEEYDTTLTDAVILYGDREALDIQPFHIEFDPEFWQTVASWAATQSTYRREKALPPPDPEASWECQYCPYQSRCGQADSTVEGSSPKGLLPGTEYPAAQLQDYLDAHKGAKLTPTTAAQHPHLAEAYPVHDWICECCAARIPFDAVDWDGNPDALPQCPACQDTGQPADLRDPPLNKQWPRSTESSRKHGGGQEENNG